ncbi:MAG TPA: hypothetical protein VNK41_06280 [Vicinamibacterales bacterium]|nr:hypothetical protein [Vicinamibacterales bacterium]
MTLLAAGSRESHVAVPAAAFDLDVHGVGVRVRCASADTLARVWADFLYFHTDAAPPIEMEVLLVPEAPRYADLPPLRATAHTPRNICYSRGQTTYIDYFGRALAIYDRAAKRVQVYSDRPHLLHEIAYLTILSRVSEALERRGLHRVHACAVSVQGTTVLFVLPSGGGKTTLTLAFMKRGGGIRVVSEDSPLVDGRGTLHPFPLRIGILADQPPPFPPEFVTYTERMEFEPKYLVSLRAFPDALETAPTQPNLLFIGTRTLGTDCRILPVSRMRGLRALVRDMIVGVGLYQGLEFLLRTSPADLLRLAPVLAGRVRAALALLRRVRVYEIELGRDPDVNVNTVLAFLEARRAKEAA